ncbi:MAG: Nif3-like dinuclear metal center hexameric protein, partial [Verrucomicrobiota bacterium]
YSPHTALDAVREGMNDWLCEGLGTTGSRWSIEVPSEGPSGKSKVVVYAPRDSADKVREAMAAAGCGGIGNYSDCSFNIDGIGTFKGGEGSNPTVGKPGQLESVEETRIEMICFNSMVGEALRSIRDSHPYEEPAIDVFQLYSSTPPEDEWQTSGRLAWLKQPTTAQALMNLFGATDEAVHLFRRHHHLNGLNPRGPTPGRRSEETAPLASSRATLTPSLPLSRFFFLHILTLNASKVALCPR